MPSRVCIDRLHNVVTKRSASHLVKNWTVVSVNYEKKKKSKSVNIGVKRDFFFKFFLHKQLSSHFKMEVRF